MDNLTSAQRHKNMSRIRSKNTKLEVRVRSYLFRHGFRFRKNDCRYPGKPDVVLPKYRTVIFVNGCFWHHHNCKTGHIPRTRTEYWMKKFHANMVNDKLHRDELEAMGWKVITVWECELKEDFEGVMQRVMFAVLRHYV